MTTTPTREGTPVTFPVSIAWLETEATTLDKVAAAMDGNTPAGCRLEDVRLELREFHNQVIVTARAVQDPTLMPQLWEGDQA